MGVLELVVLIGEGDVKLLGKARAEIVACAGLESLAVVHHALNSVGVDRAGELLLLGLVASDNGHRQIVFAHIGVNLELLQGLLAGLLLGGVQSVTLLPKELSASEEGTGGLFPAQNGAPLVVQHGQVAP